MLGDFIGALAMQGGAKIPLALGAKTRERAEGVLSAKTTQELREEISEFVARKQKSIGELQELATDITLIKNKYPSAKF